MATIKSVLELDKVTDADLSYYIKELRDEQTLRKQAVRKEAVEAFKVALDRLNEIGVDVYVSGYEGVHIVKDNIHFL